MALRRHTSRKPLAECTWTVCRTGAAAIQRHAQIVGKAEDRGMASRELARRGERSLGSERRVGGWQWGIVTVGLYKPQSRDVGRASGEGVGCGCGRWRTNRRGLSRQQRLDLRLHGRVHELLDDVTPLQRVHRVPDL